MRSHPTLFASRFGAVGDGVHDDTSALQAALDAALAERAAGRRFLLRLDEGRYRLTAPLRLPPVPLAVYGNGFVAGCGDREPAPGVVLRAEHAGPVLAYEAATAPELALHGLAIERAGALLGDGIHIVASSGEGPDGGGLDLFGLLIEGMAGDAVHLDLGDRMSTPVRVEGCAFRHNRGWGLWCTGSVVQAVVRDCAFVDNAEGGVGAGSFGLTLAHNRFARQARPVVVEGRNNRGVLVAGNAFVDIVGGRACVDLRNVHRFRIENNVFGAPGAAVPPLLAEHCSDGSSDVAGLLLDCADVVCGGYLARGAFAARPSHAAMVYSMSRTPLPTVGLSPVGVPALLKQTMLAPPPSVGLHRVRFGRDRFHVLAEDLHVPGRFTIEFPPESDLEAGDLAWFSFLLRYTVDLPGPDARIHVDLWAGDAESPLAVWALTPPPLLFLGETLQVVLGLQLARPEEPHAAGLIRPRSHPHLCVRIAPFGIEHQGAGAHVTRVMMLRLPDGGLPGRPDLHPEARAYPPPMPLLDPVPALVELVEHPRLDHGLG